MVDPDYVAVTDEAHTPERRREWVLKQWRTAHTEGCVHGRATHDKKLGLVLFEAWKRRPVDDAGNLCEGPPHWPMTAAA